MPETQSSESKPLSRHMSHPIKDWEQPRIFIETDDKGELVVNKETEKFLEKIIQPVVVVSVVGLYRTGKSFLLNRLSGLRQGFSLGGTVESETKGIWIWVVPHPNRDDCCLVLIDTEGLGDMDKIKMDHDIWIFALGILLSGTLVYNSKGAIDQKAMNDLHLVTEVAKRIKVKSMSDENIGANKKEGNPGASSSGGKHAELSEFFPTFIWALRDFSLQIKIGGKTCSPDEYLEHALVARGPAQKKELKGSAMQAAEQMHPKDCIKNYFPQRKCFVLPIPVKNTELMDQIDTLDDCDFSENFLKVVHEFCEYIFSQSNVKTIFNEITTGRALARLATIYVESIRNGNAPCIQNAVESTAQIENEQAIKESVELYAKNFEETVKFPTATQKAMCDCHAQCSKEAFDRFLSLSVFDAKRLYYQQLVVKVEEQYVKFRNENEIKSGEACKKLLSDLYQKIVETDYSFVGGYKKYEEDMEELFDTYKKTPQLEDVAARVLDVFRKEIEHTRKLILAADTKLTDTEKLEKDLIAAIKAKVLAEKAEEEERKKSKLLKKELDQIKKEHTERLTAKAEVDRKIRDLIAAKEAKELAEKAEEEERKKSKLLKEELEQIEKERYERLKAKDEENRKIKHVDAAAIALKALQIAVELAPVNPISKAIAFFRDKFGI